MEITPISFAEANEFVRRYHRTHQSMPGCKFCVAVSHEGSVRGVAITGRPVARMLDDGWTLEVNRCCTDGTRNACSALYRAAWRTARALGYRKLLTYTLPEEGGASLRGAGMTCVGVAGGGKWSRESRPAVDMHPLQEKLRWELSTEDA